MPKPDLMQERFEFYKEYYFRELDRRNQLNSSLSIPIGLITGLAGGVSYLLTNFDYAIRFWLSIPFVVVTGGGIIFLLLSIYNLIIAYTNFPRPYNYMLIADVDVIEKYHQDLKAYYIANPGVEDTSEKEFENYIVSEMVVNTGNNQKNNKKKTKFSYNCEKYLIRALMLISLSLPFFSINYALKPGKKPPYSIKIVSKGVVEVIPDSK